MTINVRVLICLGTANEGSGMALLPKDFELQKLKNPGRKNKNFLPIWIFQNPNMRNYKLKER